jgi:hypothetical protein
LVPLEIQIKNEVSLLKGAGLIWKIQKNSIINF